MERTLPDLGINLLVRSYNDGILHRHCTECVAVASKFSPASEIILESFLRLNQAKLALNFLFYLKSK